MVRAILDGRKTMTRRIVKPQPDQHHWGTMTGYARRISLLECSDGHLHARFQDAIPQNFDEPEWRKCPYGKPGDALWVREAFAVQPEIWAEHHGKQPVHYFADSPKDQIEDYKGKPSIHMPRWASRITLEVTGISVEQLQDISEEDAQAEGVTPSIVGVDLDSMQYRAGFQTLWDSINGKKEGCSWKDNPWVWAVEFTVSP